MDLVPYINHKGFALTYMNKNHSSLFLCTEQRSNPPIKKRNLRLRRSLLFLLHILTTNVNLKNNNFILRILYLKRLDFHVFEFKLHSKYWIVFKFGTIKPIYYKIPDDGCILLILASLLNL